MDVATPGSYYWNPPRRDLRLALPTALPWFERLALILSLRALAFEPKPETFVRFAPAGKSGPGPGVKAGLYGATLASL